MKFGTQHVSQRLEVWSGFRLLGAEVVVHMESLAICKQRFDTFAHGTVAVKIVLL